MITATNLIFSMASAARILAKELGDIFRKVEWIKFTGKVWIVIYRTKFGRCSTFLSTKAFKQQFVDKRKADAQELEVSKTKHGYRVSNAEKGTSYGVTPYQKFLDCNCEDFQNQCKYLGKGCCKHGYAVLFHLGFNSLENYIDHNQWTSESSQEFLF